MSQYDEKSAGMAPSNKSASAAGGRREPRQKNSYITKVLRQCNHDDIELEQYYNDYGLIRQNRRYPSNATGETYSNSESYATSPKTEETKKEDPKKEVSLAEELKEPGTFDEHGKRNFDTSLFYFQKASELQPENIIYILNQSAVLFVQGLYEECIKKCEEAIGVGEAHYGPIFPSGRSLHTDR